MSISSFKDFIEDKISQSANAKSVLALDAVRANDPVRANKLVGDVDGLREARRIIQEAYLLFVKDDDNGGSNDSRQIY